MELHWLLIEQMIKYKLLTSTFKIKKSSVPASIQPKLSKLHRQAYYKYTYSFYCKAHEKNNTQKYGSS